MTSLPMLVIVRIVNAGRMPSGDSENGATVGRVQRMRPFFCAQIKKYVTKG